MSTLREKLESRGVISGLSPWEAKEITKDVIAVDKSVAWDGSADNCPHTTFEGRVMSAFKASARKWLAKNAPDHWVRQAFEDVPSPLPYEYWKNASRLLSPAEEESSHEVIHWESGAMYLKWFFLSFKQDILKKAFTKRDELYDRPVFATRFPAVACDYALGLIKGQTNRVRSIVLAVEQKPYEEKYGKLEWSPHTCINTKNRERRLKSLKNIKMGVELNVGASQYLWNSEFYETLLPAFSLRYVSGFLYAYEGENETYKMVPMLQADEDGRRIVMNGAMFVRQAVDCLF